MVDLVPGLGARTGGTVPLVKTDFNTKSHLGHSISIDGPGIAYNPIIYIYEHAFPPRPSHFVRSYAHTEAISEWKCSKNSQKQRKTWILRFLRNSLFDKSELGWLRRSDAVVPSSHRIVLTAPRVYFDSGPLSDVPDSSEDHEISKNPSFSGQFC